MSCNMLLVLALILLAEVDFGLNSATIPQKSFREVVNQRRQLNYLKKLLQDLDDKLEKLEKRSCRINLPGMNCDYRYMKGSGKDHSTWSSNKGPGKKSRYLQPQLNSK